jgi:4-nitrophenyl phosphatase
MNGRFAGLKNIAIIILAAGASRRFGKPKQLLDWGGVPLVAHAADVALEAGLGPVIVVLGCDAEAVRTALGARAVQMAMNWRWAEGLSTSVQAGLAALSPEMNAAILMQCDQPLLTADLLRALAARFEEGEVSIVHPSHADRRGTPTLFSREMFAELAALDGDVGGRVVIARHSEAIATVEVADPDVFIDIDTPADYEHLLERGLGSRLQEPEPETSNVEPATILSRIRHLIVDMDGVLWRGDQPMPDLDAFFAFLRRRGIDFVLATNNSSRTPEQYVEKLARFGVEVPVEAILTSALVAADYLTDQAAPGTRVYAVGKEGVRRALEERGFVLTEHEVDIVVVGWNTDLVWDDLATAALLIHKGARFIGTNPDVNYPTERGPVPGNGAQLAALEVTTGVAPIVTGKPEPQMYEQAMRRMGAHPESTAVVGDRLDTDLAGGVRLGLTTMLVLSGIATEADVAAASAKPDLVCADIGELVRVWERCVA